MKKRVSRLALLLAMSMTIPLVAPASVSAETKVQTQDQQTVTKDTKKQTKDTKPQSVRTDTTKIQKQLKKTVTKRKLNALTEPYGKKHQNLTLDYKHIIPYNMTSNTSSKTKSIKSLLYFAGSYRIPAKNKKGKVVGIFSIVKKHKKWEIYAYDTDTKLYQQCLKHWSKDTYYVRIPQIGGISVLIYQNKKQEKYVTLTGVNDLQHSSGSWLLKQMKKNEKYAEEYAKEHPDEIILN